MPVCKWGDTVTMELVIPASLSATGVAHTTRVGVDRCIAQLVAALNAGGVPTLASCCGHGHRTGSIMLGDGRFLAVFPDRASWRAHEDRNPVNIQGEAREKQWYGLLRYSCGVCGYSGSVYVDRPDYPRSGLIPCRNCPLCGSVDGLTSEWLGGKATVEEVE